MVLGVLVAAALVQTTVMPRFALWGAVPNLMLAVVVSWSLRRGARQTAGIALGGGLLLDLLSGGPFGAIAGPLVACSTAATLGEFASLRESAWLPLAAAALATVVYGALQTIVLQVSMPHVDWLAGFARVLGPSIVANCVLVYPVYRALGALVRSPGRVNGRW